jgi:hypothetical protein
MSDALPWMKTVGAAVAVHISSMKDSLRSSYAGWSENFEKNVQAGRAADARASGPADDWRDQMWSDTLDNFGLRGQARPAGIPGVNPDPVPNPSSDDGAGALRSIHMGVRG